MMQRNVRVKQNIQHLYSIVKHGSRVFYSSHTQLNRIQSVVKCKSGQVCSMDSATYEHMYIQGFVCVYL